LSELNKLKKKAKILYQKAMAFGDMSCGRALAEHIRPEIYKARKEFNLVWKKIQELDPAAPANPFT